MAIAGFTLMGFGTEFACSHHAFLPNDGITRSIINFPIAQHEYYKDSIPSWCISLLEPTLDGIEMNTMRKRDGAVMVREVDSEFLLLDTEFNLIHKLNQTASFIWQTIDRVHSTSEIARLLANEYEVEQDTAVRDVVETLAKLTELKLIVVA